MQTLDGSNVFEELPIDILKFISEKLNFLEVSMCMRTCKKWQTNLNLFYDIGILLLCWALTKERPRVIQKKLPSAFENHGKIDNVRLFIQRYMYVAKPFSKEVWMDLMLQETPGNWLHDNMKKMCSSLGFIPIIEKNFRIHNISYDDASLCISENGNVLSFNKDNYSTIIYDLTKKENVYLHHFTNQPIVKRVALSCDGSSSAYIDGSQVDLWNIKDLEKTKRTLRGHCRKESGCKCNHDTKWERGVALHIYIDPTCPINGHIDRILCISFSPLDPSQLATGGVDGTIKIWNTTTLELVWVFYVGENMVGNLEWSADGMKIFSHTVDGSLKAPKPQNPKKLKNLFDNLLKYFLSIR